MQLIGSIIIGFFAGLLARSLKPGDDRLGILPTTLLGIVGSVLATFLGRSFGWYGAGEPAGFLASIVGAIVVLSIYGMFTRGRRKKVGWMDRDRRAA